MRNPLIKRLPRELLSEITKYLVIFIFMTGTIGFISGFLVAGDSLKKSYDESFEKYNIEDGNFELLNKADENLINTLEEQDLKIYNNNYIEEDSVNDSVIRLFLNREDVNKKYGNTIVMVTHNDAIKNMADRVVKMRDGQIRDNYKNKSKTPASELEW